MTSTLKLSWISCYKFSRNSLRQFHEKSEISQKSRKKCSRMSRLFFNTKLTTLGHNWNPSCLEPSPFTTIFIQKYPWTSISNIHYFSSHPYSTFQHQLRINTLKDSPKVFACFSEAKQRASIEMWGNSSNQLDGEISDVSAARILCLEKKYLYSKTSLFTYRITIKSTWGGPHFSFN